MTEQQLRHADFVVWECPCPDEKKFQESGNRHVIHPTGRCPFCGRTRNQVLADITPCGAITGPPDAQVRCTRTPVDHRGPHWQETEPLPEGCNCRTICHCKETS